MAKKKAKLSKREKEAQKKGVTVKQLSSSKKSSKKDDKKSSKTDSKFKKALKEKGAWDAYQRMSPDQQDMLAYNFNILRSDSKKDVEIYKKALEEATAQADPYWKSYLLVAQDEVQRAVDTEKSNTQSQIEKNQRLIQSIKENLNSNKEFLTLEQQSDMAQLAQNYEIKQEELIGGAADAGLTFSTKRQMAEQRLNQAQTGLVESTNRKYNKQLRDLTTEAESGSLEAQKQIEDLQRRMGQNVTQLGRSAEAQLGTSNLPQLEGYTALGNISGKMYEDKTKDIAERQQALFAEKSRESLAL